MKKKLFVLLLSLLLIAGLLPALTTSADAASIASGTCGPDVRWALSDTGILSVSGTGPMDDFTAGKAPWSSYRTKIKSIQIGYGVTRVGAYSFYNCDYAKTVRFGDDLTSIGAYAFYGCIGLTSMTLPDGLTTIEDNAFQALTTLKALTVPNGVTYIGSYAFDNCRALVSAVLPQTLTYLGSYAFNNCVCLETINIPSGIDRIREQTFNGCVSMEAMNIPEGITAIEESAFIYCGMKTLTIPSTITFMADRAFQYCDYLTEIYYYPKSYPDYSYNTSAFKGLGSASSGIHLYIGEEVERIPAYLFYYSSSSYDNINITKVTFGSKPIVIGTSAFYGCKNLQSVYISSLESWMNSTFKDNPLRFGAGLYLNGKLVTDVTIPETITDYTCVAFKGYTKLEHLTVPGTVTRIAADTFTGCTGLKTLTLEEGLTEIEAAFTGCTSLESLTIPGTVTSIADRAFENCSGLKELTIGSGITELGPVFKNCSSLETLTIPGTVSLLRSSFVGCTGLKTLTVEAGVQTITSAFQGCTALESVTLADSVTSLYYAFSDCTSLTNIDFGAGLTEIGYRSFMNCSGLKSLTIPESVTSLGDSAFYNCTGLTEIRYNARAAANCTTSSSVFYKAGAEASGIRVIFGSTVEHIPANLFYSSLGFTYAPKVKEVVYQGFVETVGTSVFYGNDALTAVHIPSMEAWCSMMFADYRANPLYYANNLYLNGKLVTDLVIPKGVTEIHSYAFYGYSKADSITIPSSVTRIGTSAFVDNHLKWAVFRGTRAQWNAVQVMSSNTELTQLITCLCEGDDHVLTDWSVKYAPTCTWDGTEIRKCSQCDFTESRTLPATGHTPVVDPYEPPTCLDAGLTEGSHCQNCHMTLVSQETIPALGHDWSDWTSVKVPTCTDPGYDVHICARCQVSQTRDFPALGHDWSDWTVSVPVSCTTDGTEVRACARCQGTENRTIPAPGHKPKGIAAVEPTCTETGLTEGSFCTVCGETLAAQEELPALGHDWSEWVVTAPASCTTDGTEVRACARCQGTENRTIPALGHKPKGIAAVEPTCTETGLTEGSFCTVCGETLAAQEIIPALGHKENILPKVEPTCTQSGLTEGKRCSVCGEILVPQEKLPALGHNWSEWEVFVNASCTQSGWEYHACLRCEANGIQEIPALGHDEEVIPGTDATCISSGLTDGIRCRRCYEILTDQEVIPALGHIWSDWAVYVPATCVDEGTEIRSCARCNSWESNPIPTTPHSPEILPAVDPTCTECGLTEGARCTVCGGTLVFQEIIPALGHDAEVIPSVEPTCTEDGLTEGSRCAVCGEILVPQEEIAPLDHAWSEWETVVPASCTESGLEECFCTRCGEHSTNELPALGHAEQDTIGFEPTCTEPGLTDGLQCPVCGEILIPQEEIPALGHNWTGWAVSIPATCLEDGTEIRICYRCNAAEYRSISTDEHTPEILPAVEPTCTEDGFTEGSRCAVCLQILVPQERITAPGHEWSSWQEVAPASCVSEGMEIQICSRCQNWVTRSTPALGHDWVCSFVQEPTYTETGFRCFACSRCGETEEQELPILPPDAGMFTDVKSGKWYYEAIDFVVKEGIMKGTSGSTFAPNDTMTRAQLAQIFYNLAGAPEEELDNPFIDVKPNKWYTKAIVWVYHNNIVSGVGNGKFAPDNVVTREQVAVMLYRYAGGAAPAENYTAGFSDADRISSWARDAMSWAVEKGYLKGSGGMLNPGGSMSRAEVAQLFMNYITSL